MCGIVGLLHRGKRPEAQSIIQRMTRSIRHRGPDAEDFHLEADIVLGCARLSLLDHADGVQPVHNEDGSLWLVVDGTIYNHRELRRELEAAGHRFASSHADAEVLVHGWEEWGSALFPKLNGMFALALWDARANALVLARDRFGVKPLYLAQAQDGSLLFASEIKALHASGLIERAPSHDGMLEYLCQQNTWGRQTCFKNLEEFPSASYEVHTPDKCVSTHYWSLRFQRDCRLSFAEAAEEHRHILSRVIARQMAADVPVVSYLSGGIDSSAITAAAHQLDPALKVYSCLFDLRGVEEDRIVDEREYSEAVARQLGVERVTFEIAQDAMADSLDYTIAAIETPRMGMAYVNYLIAARVAKDSKVVLTGSGGDEIHAGYLSRYQAVAPPEKAHVFSRAWFGQLLHKPDSPLDIYARMLNFPLQAGQLHKALTPDFLAGVTHYDPLENIKARLSKCPCSDPREVVLHTDATTYLHGLLMLDDKLSMIHSLESRVPLLDNELVDFVCRLPWTYLCDGNIGKKVFREAVRPWVPEAIYAKPKMGFGPPDASWYRGTLKTFLQERLDSRKIERTGIFQPAFVRQILDAHFSGHANNVAFIWTLLSLDSWCRINKFFDN